MAVKFFFFSFLFFTLNITAGFAQQGNAVPNKDLEVAIGIDHIENVDFDYSTKITIGNEKLLKLVLVPQKREIIFKGSQPGRTTVIVRDTVGDIRQQYTVVVTSTGKSNTVSELRELIGDVEGLEIGIKGGRVYVGGELIVPNDIGRVMQVLVNYPDVLTLIELSPQTQRVIARKMADELAKNNFKDVTVRIVNKIFWVEGVVGSENDEKIVEKIVRAFLPPVIESLSSQSDRFSKPKEEAYKIFLSVNPKKNPKPIPKMVKVTSQFVELSKSYNKVFAFKWAPLMGQDNSQIQFGQTEDGNITGRSTAGTLSATISNLFPKLNAAKSAGYARTIQSGMVIVIENTPGSISKDTTIPYALGTGEFQKASEAKIGINLTVTPAILEQEKINLDVSLDVSLGAASGSAAPVVTSNSVKTKIILKSKESAAIGGIVQNQSATDYDNTGNDPAPLASGDGAPITPLFNLYRSKSYSTNKSQYVMFITPEIVESASAGSEEIRKKFRRRE